MGRSARGDPPRGRCPGTGEVDSRERRLVVWISALAARVSLGTRRAVPKVTSRSQEERWMKRYAWAMLGLGLWVAGMEGGTRWALGQTPPPTIGPQQNRSFNPATTIPFKVSGLNERFCCGPIVGGGVCPNAHRVPPSIPATQSPSPSIAQAYRFIHRSSCERDVTLGRLSLCQVILVLPER